MHHADAQSDGLGAVGDFDFFAVNGDGAVVGLVKAVEHRHERGFARAVFADDAVDAGFVNREINVAVGPDRTEVLLYATHDDRRWSAGRWGCVG